MTKRVAIRSILGLFLIAILVLGYQWYRGLSKDIGGLLKSDTKGFLAALEYVGDGARAVVFKPDGTKIDSPDYREGANDRGVVWSPDGNRIFFTSDRNDNVYSVYRWDPERGSVERRTAGTRSMSRIDFAKGGGTALLISGGFVIEFDPTEKTTRQLLPPEMDEAVHTEEGGRADQFTAFYERIGQSFKAARWGPNRESIIATMRRDGGEVLMIQALTPQPVKLADGTESIAVPPPFVIDAADTIDFDIAADGNVVYTANGFQFKDPNNIPEQYIKNGRATPPYRQLTAFFDPSDIMTKPPTPLFVGANDSTVLIQPRCSPDSATVAYIAGTVGPNGFVPKNLVLIPMIENGYTKGRAITNGEIREINWNMSGDGLVYSKTSNGKRSIFKISANGGAEERISPEGGDYGFPVCSPQ